VRYVELQYCGSGVYRGIVIWYPKGACSVDLTWLKNADSTGIAVVRSTSVRCQRNDASERVRYGTVQVQFFLVVSLNMVLARMRCRMSEEIVSHTSVEMEEEEGDALLQHSTLKPGFFSATSDNQLRRDILITPELYHSIILHSCSSISRLLCATTNTTNLLSSIQCKQHESIRRRRV
jgi:hypothetical protein